VPNKKCTKLDQTTKKGDFVGYSATSKAYKIYIHNSRRIIMRRDVKFMDEKGFRGSRKMPIGD